MTTRSLRFLHADLSYKYYKTVSIRLDDDRQFDLAGPELQPLLRTPDLERDNANDTANGFGSGVLRPRRSGAARLSRAARRTPQGGGRVLTKSDVVTIKVVSQPDMDTTSRVELDGTVQFPYVGRIKAAGLTEDGLARAIEKSSRRPADRQRSARAGRNLQLRRRSERPGPGRRARPVHDRPDDDPAADPGARRRPEGDRRDRRRCSGKGRAAASSQRYNGHGHRLRENQRRPHFRPKQRRDICRAGAILLCIRLRRKHRASSSSRVRSPCSRRSRSPAASAQLGTDWRLKIKRKAADGQTEEVPASLDDQVQPNDTIIVNERLF